MENLIQKLLQKFFENVDLGNKAEVRQALSVLARVVGFTGQDKLAEAIRSEEVVELIVAAYNAVVMLQAKFTTAEVHAAAAFDWQSLVQMLLPLILDLLKKRIGAAEAEAVEEYTSAYNDIFGGGVKNGSDCEQHTEDVCDRIDRIVGKARKGGFHDIAIELNNLKQCCKVFRA